jgi:HipA-like protein
VPKHCHRHLQPQIITVADYPVILVQREEVIGDEGMGSKPKFWFRRGGQHWLFKEARDGTGEDWAEKVVAEVARIAGISAATVQLAEFQGRRGCACLSFARPEQAETLIHGNEILAGFVLGYDPKKTFHQSDHTLDNIARAIHRMFPEKAHHEGILAGLGSYLVLDALVGNTDRHHENWAILAKGSQVEGGVELTMEVAPSFDHASSLGRELLDEGRKKLLEGGRVGNYIRRGHGAIFQNTTDKRGVNPLDLVEFGARTFPDYFVPALQRLKGVPLQHLQDTVADVPTVRMSDVSKNFVRAFMAYTHEVLTKLPQ